MIKERLKEYILENYTIECGAARHFLDNILNWVFLQSMDYEDTINSLASLLDGIGITINEIKKFFVEDNFNYLRTVLIVELVNAREKYEDFEGTMSFMLGCIKDGSFDEWNYLKDAVSALSDDQVNSILEEYGDDEYMVCVNGSLVPRKEKSV